MIRALVCMVLVVGLVACTRRVDSERLAKAFSRFPLKLKAESAELKRFEGTLDGEVLNVTVLNRMEPAAARSAIELEKSKTLSAFSSQTLPYGGAVSKSIECPGRVAPIFSGTPLDLSAKLDANERFTPGGCEAAIYSALFRYLYCEKYRALMIMKLFVKKDARVDFSPVTQIQCSSFRS